jgi:outer membrane protein TolC
VKALKRFVTCFFVILLLIGICSAQEKLTLEQSLLIAFEQSPRVLKAKAEIEAAEGVEGQARAGYLPQLALKGGIGKYYAKPMTVEITFAGSPQAFTYGTDEQADTINYSLSLSQNVFTGGKISNSLAMANKGLMIAREEYRRVAEEVKFNVISGYYGILKAKKMVELSEQSVKMAKSHLEHIRALLNVGMSTRADRLRGEVQLANAEVGLTKAKQGLEIAKNHFNNALGRDLGEVVELAEVEYESKDVQVYDYKGLLEIAYEDRPDWKQYILTKKISENEVGLAQSDLWPMVALVGNYDVGSTKYSSYSNDTETWTAMLSGTWNIFDGTATWNKIKESRAKLEANRANERDVKKAIALEVKDANFALSSAKENLEGTQKALDLAEENFRIADLRYNSGVGTNLEVLDAQVAVTQARIDRLQAQHDLQVAKARINRVAGRKIY